MNAFHATGELRKGEYARTSTGVLYRCTGCGETSEIGSHDYGITAGGDVRPAFVCPLVECQAEVTLTLIDWSAR